VNAGDLTGAGSLSLTPARFGRNFPRIFVFRQADISHGAIVTGKRHTIAVELGILELTPHVQLVLDACLTCLLGSKPGRRQPVIGRWSLGSRPEGPYQKDAYGARFFHIAFAYGRILDDLCKKSVGIFAGGAPTAVHWSCGYHFSPTFLNRNLLTEAAVLDTCLLGGVDGDQQ